MKNLIILFVLVFSSSLYCQNIHIQTGSGSDSFRLTDIDSSLIFNRQVFKSHDSIGVTAIFPAGSFLGSQKIQFNKFSDHELENIIDEISEENFIIIKSKAQIRINFGNIKPNVEKFIVYIKIPSEIIEKTNDKLNPKMLLHYVYTSEYSSQMATLIYQNKVENGIMKIDIDGEFIQNYFNEDGNYEIVLSSILAPNETGLSSTVKKRNDKIQSDNDKIGSPFGKGINFKLSQDYEDHRDHGIYGVDFRSPQGTNLYAVKKGEVIACSLHTGSCYVDPIYIPDGCDIQTGYGNLVKIKHTDNSIATYGHLSQIDVYNGQKVDIGTQIGKSGGKCGEIGSGCSTGPHLHFEYKLTSGNVDPMEYIDINLEKENIIGYKSTLMNDGREWMIENINSGTIISKDQNPSNNGFIEKYCPDGNCQKYGGLYQWNEAMNYVYSNRNGICPAGWYIPSEEEWTNLINSLGNLVHEKFLPQYGGSRYDPIGDNAMYVYQGNSANYWTSDKLGLLAFSKRINKNSDQINTYSYTRNNDAFCVRCIKEKDGYKSPNISYIKAGKTILNQTVEIFGNWFGMGGGSVDVLYDYKPLPPIEVTPNKIVFKIPETSTYGNLISVKNSDGKESNTIYLRVDEEATKPYPYVHFLSPNFTYEGKEVTIFGNHFGAFNSGTSKLLFGTEEITVLAENWQDDNIKFTIPEGIGSGNILVQVEDRKSKPYYYDVAEKPAPTPYINYIEPQMAEVRDTVKINGRNFGNDLGNSEITFNGVKAEVTQGNWSEEVITVVVPAAAESGNVVVKVNQDVSNEVYFVVIPPAPDPVLTSIEPDHFQTGELVSISGNYFGYNQYGTDFVEFNSFKVDLSYVNSWTNKKIELIVPDGISNGQVFVTIDGRKSNGIQYTIDEPNNDSSGTVTDSEGKEYKTIKIGDQWWMAENLRTGEIVESGKGQTDNSKIERFSYNDDDLNEGLGGIYLWDEAMNWSAESQGICPNGWHIPSVDDWQDLITFLGDNPGLKLKEGGNSGFEALMSGSLFVGPYYRGLNNETFFWTSTQTSGSNAYSINISSSSSNINITDDQKENGFCIRCIKNK